MPAPSSRGPRPLHALLACAFASFLSHVGSDGAACNLSTTPASMQSFPSNSASRRLNPDGKPDVNSNPFSQIWHNAKSPIHGIVPSKFYLELLAKRINDNWKKNNVPDDKLLRFMMKPDDKVSIFMGAGVERSISVASALKLLESGIFDNDPNPEYLTAVADGLDVHFKENWEIRRRADGRCKFFVGKKPHLLPLPESAFNALNHPNAAYIWASWRKSIQSQNEPRLSDPVCFPKMEDYEEFKLKALFTFAYGQHGAYVFDHDGMLISYHKPKGPADPCSFQELPDFQFAAAMACRTLKKRWAECFDFIPALDINEDGSIGLYDPRWRATSSNKMPMMKFTEAEVEELKFENISPKLETKLVRLICQMQSDGSST
eukprot:GHVT01053856.1.p1 GENE.GHVT01053856.1~~GHVT01053856.1.p1  ORF type:complete len:375 (+),score=36.12 GHVT01053856.1:195-1319(+)